MSEEREIAQPVDYPVEDDSTEDKRGNLFVLIGLMLLSWLVIVIVGNGLMQAIEYLTEALK